MPWGTSKKQVQKKAQRLVILAAANKKAKALHRSAIKTLSTPKRSKYHGIFFYIYLTDFCKLRKLSEILVILLIIIDFYEIFEYQYLQDWGLHYRDDELTMWIRKMRKYKFIDRGYTKKAHYYLTLSGRNIVDEFHTYYETARNAHLKRNADGHKKLIVYFSRGDLLRNRQIDKEKGVRPIVYREWNDLGKPLGGKRLGDSSENNR